MWCVQRCSGPYPFHLNLSPRPTPLINYVAENYSKPIVGVIPWGGERTLVRVRGVADAMVRWNTQSIVDAIRIHAI